MDNIVKPISEIIQNALQKAMSYKEYRKFVSELTVSKSNSGSEQTEALIEYTQLNNRRMNRWDKTLKIPTEVQEKLAKLNRNLTFLVLTESWCGDASPSLPVMNKIAELNSNIGLQIVLRDENLDLMNQFLTNNAMSIPKLIILDNNSEKVIADWGPRPREATKMVEDYKAAHGKLTSELKESLQMWYNKDKGEHILAGIVSLLPLK